jgi:hypothetical protein
LAHDQQPPRRRREQRVVRAAGHAHQELQGQPHRDAPRGPARVRRLGGGRGLGLPAERPAAGAGGPVQRASVGQVSDDTGRRRGGRAAVAVRSLPLAIWTPRNARSWARGVICYGTSP